MFSDPIASLMAAESTRRTVTKPPRVTPPRRSRRAFALVLQRAAHRLDPCVTAAPRVSLGR